MPGDGLTGEDVTGLSPGDDAGAPGSVGPVAVVLLVDAANVVGSRPDGWWRDRVGATHRLLARLAGLVGETVAGPAHAPVRVVDVRVVVEGAARAVGDHPGLVVHRAARDGDAEVVAQAARARAGTPGRVLVVTADRGLRARLGDAEVAGPSWLLRTLDAQDGGGTRSDPGQADRR